MRHSKKPKEKRNYKKSLNDHRKGNRMRNRMWEDGIKSEDKERW